MLSKKWFVYVLACIFCFCFGYIIPAFCKGDYGRLTLVFFVLFLISGILVIIGLHKLEKAEES